MKINMIANEMRTQRGELLAIEMLRGELREAKTLKPLTTAARVAKKLHIKSLEAMIQYKENRKQ